MLIDNQIVHCLWFDTPISKLEKNCFKSWVENDYECWVWSYDELDVPDGVILKDANEILPNSKIFRYQSGNYGLGSVSGFSNFFRYKALFEYGGIWADADMYCLKRLPNHPFIFIQEPQFIATCLFAVPKNSEIMRMCWEACTEFETTTLSWATSGPILLNNMINKLRMNQHIYSPNKFIPVMWLEIEKLLTPPALDLNGCYSLHFWHQQMKEKGYDKNSDYSGSTYAQLIR